MGAENILGQSPRDDEAGVGAPDSWLLGDAGCRVSLVISILRRCAGMAESVCQASILNKAYSYMMLKLGAAHSWGTYRVYVIILLVPTSVFDIRS